MIAAITFTADKRPEWLRECCESVAAQSFDGLKHMILHCPDTTDWHRGRWESTQLADYFAWVDDDDVVMGVGLSLCLQALEKTGVGVAFTRKCTINERGQEISRESAGAQTMADVIASPMGIHHLAVIRRSALDPVVLETAERIGTGFDWLCKAYAALNHGAVHVPVIGYGWRRHPDQQTRSRAWLRGFNAKRGELRAAMRAWDPRVYERIETWEP